MFIYSYFFFFVYFFIFFGCIALLCRQSRGWDLLLLILDPIRIINAKLSINCLNGVLLMLPGATSKRSPEMLYYIYFWKRRLIKCCTYLYYKGNDDRHRQTCYVWLLSSNEILISTQLLWDNLNQKESQVTSQGLKGWR